MRHRFTEVSSLPLNPPDYQESEPVRTGLVLTGGGAYGAFEAGVLEAILPHLSNIEFITGTSAGAGNAIASGSGLNHSGASEAIKRLRQFWAHVKDNSPVLNNRHLRFFTDMFLPPNMKWPNIPSLPFNMAAATQAFLPSLVAQFVSRTVSDIVPDWQNDVQNGKTKIVVNTVLETNTPGAFEHYHLSGHNLTPDGVGASTNLKNLGIHYISDTNNPDLLGRRAYDGAYAENGPLDISTREHVTDIIMIILHDRRHNKMDAKGGLKHAEIHSHVLAKMAEDTTHPVRFHAIEIENLGGEIGGLSHMDDSSKMNADGEFIDMLYAAGKKAGKEWWKKNGRHIGYLSTYDIYSPALKQDEHHLAFA